MMEHQCAGADLRLSTGRISVSPKLIVKSPRPDVLSQRERFWRKNWIGGSCEHAVKDRKMTVQHLPRARIISCLNHRARSVNH